MRRASSLEPDEPSPAGRSLPHLHPSLLGVITLAHSDGVDSRTPAPLAGLDLDSLIGLSEAQARQQVVRRGGIVEALVLSVEGQIASPGNLNPRRVRVLMDNNNLVVKVWGPG